MGRRIAISVLLILASLTTAIAVFGPVGASTDTPILALAAVYQIAALLVLWG